MKRLFVLAQIVIFTIFLTAFVITGWKVIFDPTVTETVKGIFNELKLLFSGLLSIEALKRVATNSNGGTNDEKASAPAPDTAS